MALAVAARASVRCAQAALVSVESLFCAGGTDLNDRRRSP